MPTFVTWGLLDTSEANSSGEKLAAEIPGARTHIYPDVAHMVSLEKPSEFNALLAEFLAEADRKAN